MKTAIGDYYKREKMHNGNKCYNWAAEAPRRGPGSVCRGRQRGGNLAILRRICRNASRTCFTKICQSILKQYNAMTLNTYNYVDLKCKYFFNLHDMNTF